MWKFARECYQVDTQFPRCGNRGGFPVEKQGHSNWATTGVLHRENQRTAFDLLPRLKRVGFRSYIVNTERID